MPDKIRRNREGILSLDGLDRRTRRHPAEQWQLYGLGCFLWQCELNGTAEVPFARDDALAFEVAEVFVDRGERREAKVRADLLQGRRVAVRSHIVLEVIPHFFLPAGQDHSGLLSVLCQRTEGESRDAAATLHKVPKAQPDRKRFLPGSANQSVARSVSTPPFLRPAMVQ